MSLSDSMYYSTKEVNQFIFNINIIRISEYPCICLLFKFSYFNSTLNQINELIIWFNVEMKNEKVYAIENLE